MKINLDKFMSFTPENLEMIGTKIQKTHKKKQLMEFKRSAFEKARAKHKIKLCGTIEKSEIKSKI